LPREVVLGVIIGAQGLTGEVKVKTFTEKPENLGAYGPLRAKDGRTFDVLSARFAKPGLAVVRLRDVDNRDRAEALVGTELCIARDRLPAVSDNEFYHADLVGLRAEDAQGRRIGEVRAIHNFGAGDVIEIAREDGGTMFLPFTRETVPDIDMANERVVVVEPEDEEALARRGVE
jgi:16S rRNA processing protein RimM